MDSDQGKIALVTGGASGIGWATCRELSSRGWRVAVADIDLAAASDRVEEEPERMFALELDVRSQASVDAAVEQAVSRCDRIDLLVNSAGITRLAPIEKLPWDLWEEVIDVNLNGTLRCVQAVGRRMIESGGGSIVNVSSIAGERGSPHRAPYAVSKAGVVALTRTAAVEWAPRGIRVNAVGPGYVETPLVRGMVAEGEVDIHPMLSRTPMGRLAAAEEIARVICFLGSADASYVTGEVLFADGGFLADYGVAAADS